MFLLMKQASIYEVLNFSAYFVRTEEAGLRYSRAVRSASEEDRIAVATPSHCLGLLPTPTLSQKSLHNPYRNCQSLLSGGSSFEAFEVFRCAGRVPVELFSTIIPPWL